jgi:hypothetical protein
MDKLAWCIVLKLNNLKTEGVKKKETRGRRRRRRSRNEEVLKEEKNSFRSERWERI